MPNASELGQKVILDVTTRGLPANDKFEFWRELTRYAGTELDCSAANFAPFDASAKAIIQGALSIADVESSACRLARDPDRGPSDGTHDSLMIYFVTAGRITTEQDGRSAILLPGDGALYVADRPFIVHLDQAASVIALRLPRTILPRQSDLSRFTALSFKRTGGIGTMMYNFASGLSREAPAMESATLDRMTRILVDMMDASFDQLAGEDPWKGARPSAVATLARMKSYIHGNLANSDLSPGRVAAQMKLSIRYLNRLFESEGTSLARYIWDRRVERVAIELANPARPNQPMTRIAASFGFKNQSHFSHAFRARFGVSPTAYRLRSATSPTAEELPGLEKGKI